MDLYVIFPLPDAIRTTNYRKYLAWLWEADNEHPAFRSAGIMIYDIPVIQDEEETRAVN